MSEHQLLNITKILSAPQKIVVLTHLNPDGDAIGSALGVYNYLTLKGHDVSVIVPNEVPGFLSWLPGNESIRIVKDEEELCKKLTSDASVIFCVDFNAIKRIEALADTVLNSKAYKVLIDHHPHPEEFCDLAISTVKTSSTAELIYDFIHNIGDEKHISKEVAECLFVGIMTDTGSFSYSCDFPKTYIAIAKLIEKGIVPNEIHRKVYDNYSADRMRLLGFCLSDRMTVMDEYNTAFIMLSKKDLERFNFKAGDTEGIVNYPLSISNVNLAVLFTELNGYIKISFRSKGLFSVNTMAREHFNGGGHLSAAGANYEGTLQEAVDMFLKILPLYKEQIKNANSA